MFTVLTSPSSQRLYSRGHQLLIIQPWHPRTNPATPSHHHRGSRGVRGKGSSRLCKVMGSTGTTFGHWVAGVGRGLLGSKQAAAPEPGASSSRPRPRVAERRNRLGPASSPAGGRRGGPSASTLAQVAPRERDVPAPPPSRGIPTRHRCGPELRAAHPDPARARPLASRRSAPASAAPASGFCSAATRAASAA